MTLTQQIITIAIVVLGTMLTRFLPFLLFPAGKPTPKYVRYLGKVLPPAVFGMLVIYCLKNVSIFTGSHVEKADAPVYRGRDCVLYAAGAAGILINENPRMAVRGFSYSFAGNYYPLKILSIAFPFASSSTSLSR